MTDPSSSQRSSSASRRPMARRLHLTLGAGVLVVGAFGGVALLHSERAPAPVGAMVEALTGANPHPIRLLRPRATPLSALAVLGRAIFFDPALSQSGLQSCASCHSPAQAYGPPNAMAAQFGGAQMTEAGLRAPPSLAYLYRQQPFSIGPDPAGEDSALPSAAQMAVLAKGSKRPAKAAGLAAVAKAMTPEGGLFWDGRSDTLQAQASGPLLNPQEMANTSQDEVARKLARASYASQFKPLFGANILHRPGLLVAEAMSAVARYQIEDRSFHAFDSKYDDWLEGKARFTPAEMRGYRLFNDRSKANCSSCHLSQPTPDGLPPLFTDSQYEALGLPRDPQIKANRDPGFFDMGLCGPLRTDLAQQTQYCGMFLTPTLRNSATRKVFFHNGVYHSLAQVLAFYNLRDTAPQRIYPRNRFGGVDRFNDLPVKYHANIDIIDAPFGRRPKDAPAMTDANMKDIIAFLKTLNDQPNIGAN